MAFEPEFKDGERTLDKPDIGELTPASKHYNTDFRPSDVENPGYQAPQPEGKLPESKDILRNKERDDLAAAMTEGAGLDD